MNTVDISALGNLAPVQPLDLSVIPEQPARKEFSFPKAGVYEVRAPESFPSEAFTPTQNGSWGARVDPVVVGPTNEGFEVRYQRIYPTVYTDPRTGLETSSVAQYLQAFGITEKLDGTAQQAIDLIASTAGKTAKAYLQWEIRHAASGFKLRGMKQFPKGINGEPQPWAEHPDETLKGEDGQRLRLRANVFISRWIPLGQS